MKILKHFLFVFTDKGKLIISYLICLIYWFSSNKPQLVFAVLSTIITTILLIYEFILYFQKVENFLNSKGIEFINRKKTTIDINNLEQNLEKKMNSSNGQNNSNITNNIGSSIVDKSPNQQNPQIVDVVSGYV